MERDGSEEPPRSSDEMLETQAGRMIAQHGPRAMQCVVDEIQRALRQGDEECAQERQGLLRRIERRLHGDRQ